MTINLNIQQISSVCYIYQPKVKEKSEFLSDKLFKQVYFHDLKIT